MNHKAGFVISSPERRAVRGGNCLFLGSMMTFFQNVNLVFSFAENWWQGEGGVFYCLSFKKAEEKGPGRRA